MSDGRLRVGITMVEVITVVAIVTILTAITFPLVARSREAAKEAACASNLHQLSISLELYRGDQSSVYGTADDMGLPESISRLDIKSPLVCKGKDPNRCKSPGFYEHRWPALRSSSYYYEPGATHWASTMERQGDATVAMVDPNHQLQCPVNPFSVQRIIGVTFSGSVKVYKGRGNYRLPGWWNE